MAKCELTGKARMTGNLVSHSNRKTRTVRKANSRSKR
ncbi:MAG: L28 family ribosomal protein, partial [Myxococcota bacterium]